MSERWGSPPVPREHGAWAMVAAPAVVGLGLSAPAWWAAIALILAVLVAFCAQHAALEALIRPKRRARMLRWLGVYTVLLAMVGVPLLWIAPELGFLGAVAAVYFGAHAWMARRPSRRAHRHLAFETLTVAVLTSPGAAGAWVAGAGDTAAVLAWVASFLFFAGSVFHVRAIMRTLKHKAALTAMGRLVMSRESLVLHAALAVVVAWAFVELGALAGLWATLAFGPAVVRAAVGTANLGRNRPSLKRVGLLEAAWTVAFVAGAIPSLRAIAGGA